MDPQLSPLQRYQQDLKKEGFTEDAAQRAAVEALQSVYEALIAGREAAKGKRLIKRKASFPQGLYMWGGVGRGKTYLMDTFYSSLPHSKKVRIHFHRFMQQVHDELNKLGNIQDPLEKVADTIVGNARIICFDEFFVTDITDAMLLGGLFTALFERGITLVATSNIPPDDLYKGGLQRERFLPAIDQLKKFTTTMNVDGGTDYRLRTLERAETYLTPLNDENQQKLDGYFADLAPGKTKQGLELVIDGRAIPTVKVSDDVAWFTWAALCDGPRGPADYIALAKQFQTVILSDIPVIDYELENQARRFINLVDEFYDRQVKVMISAAAPLEELYTGERVKFEFDRTKSRLLEMQSKEFLGRPHLA